LHLKLWPSHIELLQRQWFLDRSKLLTCKNFLLLAPSKAEYFQFNSVLDQNKQLNRFFKKVFEPNQTKNRFKPINFSSVRFFPFQTGSNRNTMPICHPLKINNVVLVVTTSCKEKNNCKKTVSVISNYCFDFSEYSSASRPEIIPLMQSRWDLFMPWPMKENQVNQWKNHQHGRLEEKKTDLTQMLKGNIEALPVINYFSFTLRDERQRARKLWMKGTLQAVKAFKGLMGGRGRPATWFFFYICIPNRFGLTSSGTPKLETEPNQIFF